MRGKEMRIKMDFKGGAVGLCGEVEDG